ncbi:MAG: hypothetical protein IJK56_08665 [Firmicutes bacterium]|nr:hypothetical protein [Bacillota bacterium]
MNRTTLLEIIVEQKKQIEDLQARLDAAEKRLATRNVTVDLQNIESWDVAAQFLKQACSADEAEETWL